MVLLVLCVITTFAHNYPHVPNDTGGETTDNVARTSKVGYANPIAFP